MSTSSQLKVPDLSHDRSNGIISYLLRHQIATNDALHQSIFPEVSVATAQKLISKMIKRGLLKRWFFYGSKSYLTLGPAAIARWNYPSSYARRPGPQILPYLWGCLSLCSKSDPPLDRLLPDEIAERYPRFPESRDLQQWAYYADDSAESPRLGMIRVEFRTGGFTVINKLAEQLNRYRTHIAVNELMQRSQFFVHLVAATPEQETSFWEAAERTGFDVELRTCHDPSLTLFL